ncbi:uncharacterized protein PFLUO_LOCUS6414 [Penicillium psychrofluorescens]|uniref:uncharacterized protein n=1 Tax=Penicillium psychrofluorescens TaxID=3158075 RepID=UPI003CCD3B7B
MAKFIAALSLFSIAHGLNQASEHSVPVEGGCSVLPTYNPSLRTAGPFRLRASDCDLADASRSSCSFLRSPSSINVYTTGKPEDGGVQEIKSGEITFVDRYKEGYYPGWVRCVDPAADAPQDALPTFQIKVPTKIGVDPMPEEWKTIRVANNENSARMVWGESDDTPTLPLQMYHDYSWGNKIAGINVGAHNFTRWAVERVENATSLPAHKEYASVRLLRKDSEVHRNDGEFTTLLRIEGTD